MAQSDVSTDEPVDNDDPVGAGINFTDPNGPLARYYVRTSHVVAAALLAAVFVFISIQPLWYTDVWGHLKYGKYVVEHGRVPDVEPFADLADKQSPYVTYYWFSQAWLYVVYHLGELIGSGDTLQRTAGGAEMLHLVHALCNVLRCLFLLLAIKRLTNSLPVAIAGVVATMTLGVANFGVLRPQIVAEVYFAILLWLLSGPSLSWRGIVGLVLLFAAWANGHGSFLVGLFILGAAGLGHVTDGWPPSAAAKRMLVGLAAAFAATLVNPCGPKLYGYILELSRHPNIADMDEWKSVAWGTPWGVIFAATLAILALTVLVGLVCRDGGTKLRRGLIVTHVLLVVVVGVQTYLHQRMMPFWVMLVPWVVAVYWAILFERWWSPAWTSVPSFRKTMIAVLLVWVFLAWSPYVNWVRTGQPRTLASSLHAATPWHVAAELVEPTGTHDAALGKWLHESFPEGRFRGRVFATETLGDYLLWALPSDIPIFTYTHTHLYPREPWVASKRVKAGVLDWQDILDNYHVNLIVTEAELFPQLRQRLQEAPDTWTILTDETGLASKKDVKGRLLVAARRKPILPE